MLIKTAAAAIITSCLCLLLRRSNPELTLPLSALMCVGALSLCAGMLSPMMELLRRAGQLGGVDKTLFLPVIKSVGIGICSALAADLCKDSGQGAISGVVETVGAVCALYTAMPLIESLLDILEALV